MFNLYRPFLNVKRYAEIPNGKKQLYRESNYDNILMQSAIMTFDIENMDKATHDTLERILYTWGIACIGNLSTDKNKIVVGLPNLTKDKKGNHSMDSNLIPYCTDGQTLNGEKIVNACIIRNNSDCYPDKVIFDRYAYQLSKCDESEYKLIQKSMCNPIIMLSDSKLVNEINNALKKCGQEDKQAFLTQDNSWFEDTGKHFEQVDFTNISYAEKFKYLESYHDYLERRFYFMRGMANQSPTKLAQTTNDELENRNDTSMIYVTQELEVRKHDMEQANKKLGTNFIYKFNELWTNYQKLQGMESVNDGE